MGKDPGLWAKLNNRIFINAIFFIHAKKRWSGIAVIPTGKNLDLFYNYIQFTFLTDVASVKLQVFYLKRHSILRST